MHVAGRRDASTPVGLGKRQGELPGGGVDNIARVDYPVVLRCVAIEIRRIGKDAREVGECMLYVSC